LVYGVVRFSPRSLLELLVPDHQLDHRLQPNGYPTSSAQIAKRSVGHEFTF
jgi:hypothetical protein